MNKLIKLFTLIKNNWKAIILVVWMSLITNILIQTNYVAWSTKKATKNVEHHIKNFDYYSIYRDLEWIREGVSINSTGTLSPKLEKIEDDISKINDKITELRGLMSDLILDKNELK